MSELKAIRDALQALSANIDGEEGVQLGALIGRLDKLVPEQEAVLECDGGARLVAFSGSDAYLDFFTGDDNFEPQVVMEGWFTPEQLLAVFEHMMKPRP